MSRIEKCQSCPLPEGIPCAGTTVEYAVFCEYAAKDDESYRTHVRAVNDRIASRPAPKQKTASSATYTPASRESIDRAKSCVHRECRTGCQNSVCHAGRGNSWGEVSMLDCVKCVQTGWYAFESNQP